MTKKTNHCILSRKTTILSSRVQIPRTLNQQIQEFSIQNFSEMTFPFNSNIERDASSHRLVWYCIGTLPNSQYVSHQNIDMMLCEVSTNLNFNIVSSIPKLLSTHFKNHSTPQQQCLQTFISDVYQMYTGVVRDPGSR